MNRRGFGLALLLQLLWLSAAGAWAQAPAPDNGQPQSLPKSPLAVVTGDSTHYFTVQLADEPHEHQRGLMFRKSMPTDHGMLFDFGRADRRSFWMKNTYLPLDIIFVRANGRIANIERGEPHSTASVRSRGRVRAVLEFNAGTAQQLGIGPGDLVRHEIFGNLENDKEP